MILAASVRRSVQLSAVGGERRAPHRVGEVGTLHERLSRALTALTDVLALERQVRAALLEHAGRRREVDEVGRRVDAGAPADVELRLLERRGALLCADTSLTS